MIALSIMINGIAYSSGVQNISKFNLHQFLLKLIALNQSSPYKSQYLFQNIGYFWIFSLC